MEDYISPALPAGMLPGYMPPMPTAPEEGNLAAWFTELVVQKMLEESARRQNILLDRQAAADEGFRQLEDAQLGADYVRAMQAVQPKVIDYTDPDVLRQLAERLSRSM